MSNLAMQIPVVALMDKESDYLSHESYIITKGSKNALYRTIVATSSTSSSTTFSNADPPSNRNIISRHVALTCNLRLTVNGSTSNNENILQSGSYGLKQYPLNSSISSATVTLNSRAFTTQPSEYVRMLLWYNNEFNMRERFGSMTADARQRFQHWEDGLNTTNNPLSGYNDSNPSDTGNGELLITSFVNTPTQAIVEFTVTEYLLVSPLLGGAVQKKGLTKINNMSVQLNWESNIAARMFAFAQLPTHTYTSIQVEQAGAPVLQFRYLEPSMIEAIPKTIYYNVNRYNTYITNAGTLAAGATGSFQSDNFSVGYIPSKLFIALRRDDADITCFNSENFAAITNVSLVFDTKNLLSNASVQQLFQMSNANGYAGTFSDFSQLPRYLSSGVSNTSVRGAGCVLCLTLDTSNLGVGALEAETECPGMGNGRWQFYFKITATNCSREPINYKIYTCAVEAGVVTIDENNTILENYGPITPLDVLNARVDPSIETYSGPDFAGAGFFDSLKNVASKIGHVASAALANPVVGTLVRSGAKALLGLGYGEEGEMAGGALSGGARMPRHSLRHRLR